MNQAEMEKKLVEMAAKIEALTEDNARLAAVQTDAPKRYYTKRPQKFYTLCDRYVHGKYVRATPEHPAVVLFDNDVKIPVLDNGMPEDGTLIPFSEKKPEPPKTEGLIKPYADLRGSRPEEGPSDSGSRPSDSDPAARA